MDDDQKGSGARGEAAQPGCSKCGGGRELLTILLRTSEHPSYEIFHCLECGFVDWIAQPAH